MMRRSAFDRARGEQANALAFGQRASEQNRLRAGAFDWLTRQGLPGASANALAGLLDYVPVVGDASGAEDAYQAARGGDYGTAALLGGAALVGLAPGVGDAASAGVKRGIRAFHGSPHDFDRFDISKIGTGEGAQAYGHGLYFAENEGVARSYRDNLAEPTFRGVKLTELPEHQQGPVFEIQNWLANGGVSANEARDKVINSYLQMLETAKSTKYGYPGRAEEHEAALSFLRGLTDAELAEIGAGGRMYEVRINADPDDFLDWDKPLSEQKPERLAEVMRWQKVPPTNNVGEPTTGGQLVDYLERSGGKQFATDELRDAGIPGIRYLDAGSRGAGDGSRNYVVFDDSLIEILRKYGIGAVMAGGAYALTDEEYRQVEQML